MTQLVIQPDELAPQTPQALSVVLTPATSQMWPKQVGLACGGWALGFSGVPVGDDVCSGPPLADSTLLSLQVNCIPRLAQGMLQQGRLSPQTQLQAGLAKDSSPTAQPSAHLSCPCAGGPGPPRVLRI